MEIKVIRHSVKVEVRRGVQEGTGEKEPDRPETSDGGETD